MNAEEQALLKIVNENLRDSEKGQALAREITPSPWIEPKAGWKATLERIAAKLDIQPLYKDVHRTQNREIQRLLELDLMPMVAFFGVGTSEHDANEMATRCAVGYLTTVLRVDAGTPNTETSKSTSQAQDTSARKITNDTTTAEPGYDRKIVVLGVKNID